MKPTEKEFEAAALVAAQAPGCQLAATAAAGGADNTGYVQVPIAASEELLVSMAVRSRHDYGLWDAEKQAGARLIMRQVHEEVVGTGFYTYPEVPYAARRPAATTRGAWVNVADGLPEPGTSVLLLYNAESEPLYQGLLDVGRLVRWEDGGYHWSASEAMDAGWISYWHPISELPCVAS